MSLYLHLCSVLHTFISKTFFKSLVTSWGFLMDFFYSSTEIHCSLPVWYCWLMLSDFESYSGCFLLKAESVTLSCQIYIYSICSEYDSAYELIFYCQIPTLQTASWHSANIFSRLTALLKKNRRKHSKAGNSVGTWVCLFNVPRSSQILSWGIIPWI